MRQTDKILIDTLHTLLCDLPHANDMMELATRGDEKCYYYLEECLAECDELPDHLHWQSQAQELKTLMGLADPAQVLRSVYRVLDLIEQLENATFAERELFQLLYKALQ